MACVSPVSGSLQTHVRTPAMLAAGPRALEDKCVLRKPCSQEAVALGLTDPESPGSWNSQKQMGVGGEHFSPPPMSVNSLTFLSIPLSHLTVTSFLLVGENKQQKVKTLLLASVNKK